MGVVKMKNFNKILITILAIIVIALIIFIIYRNRINDNKEVSNNEDFEFIKTSEIESIEEIENPEEIIYYIDGNKKIINRGTKEYEEIVDLNRTRSISKWGLLKTAITGLDEDTPNSWLEYKYDKFSIYFSLKEDEENYLWVPKNEGFMGVGAYGYISSGREINIYINQNNK